MNLNVNNQVMTNKEKEVFFQVMRVTFKHPITGDNIVRNFVGQAVFTPKELQAYGDMNISDIFIGMEIDQPYNPYQDEDNAEAHRSLTEKVRESLKDNSG